MSVLCDDDAEGSGELTIRYGDLVILTQDTNNEVIGALSAQPRSADEITFEGHAQPQVGQIVARAC